MAKKIIGMVKLQVKGGQANPSPPIGPALGQHGVNIAEFCKAFNAKTQDQAGIVIPVIITIYADRTISFITKTPRQVSQRGDRAKDACLATARGFSTGC